MSIDKRLISTGAAPAVCTADTLDIFGDSSCVALYGLNYDASDAGGNYNGTPTDVTFNAPGYIDYAASFNGSSSSVSVTTTSTTPVDFSARSYSLSLWVNTTSTTLSSLLSKYGDSDAARSFTLLLQANGTIRHVERATGTSTQTDSTGTINDDNWHHIVVTKSSTATTIYIDGSSDIQNSNTFTSNNGGTEPFRIGRDNIGSPEWFNGSLDQVRIFNKVLSAAEVTTLYGEVACEYTCTTDTNGFPASASSNLVAYYKLDGDATDDTGSYNGTATDVTFNGGRYGSSAVFNGSSSFINTGISNTTIPLSSDFSISTWINTNSSSGFFIAEGNFNSWNTAGFGLGIISSNRVELSFGNVAPSGGPQVQSSALAADTWYHIVAVVDIGNVLTLYVNGVSVGTDTITSSNRTSVSGGFNIGRDAGGYDYTGKLDQIRFYTKALSSTEVSSLYEDEHQCYITVDSTDPFGDSSNIALYEFENNANDSTGSYNGTATNVTYSTDSILGTYAASFNGSNSYITTSMSSSNFGTGGIASFSWWWNPNTSSTTIHFLFEGDVGNTYGVHTGGSAGTLGLRVLTKNTGGTSTFLDVANAYTTGVWQHHVVTIGNGEIKLYRDGSLIGSTTYSGNLESCNSFQIGKRSTSYYYSGEMDQFRIFNTVLDGDEIWKLYAEVAKG